MVDDDDDDYSHLMVVLTIKIWVDDENARWLLSVNEDNQRVIKCY